MARLMRAVGLWDPKAMRDVLDLGADRFDQAVAEVVVIRRARYAGPTDLNFSQTSSPVSSYPSSPFGQASSRKNSCVEGADAMTVEGAEAMTVEGAEAMTVEGAEAMTVEGAGAVNSVRQVEVRGATDQWAAIYQRHSTFIYQVLLGKVRNQADAEDLTAEVFIRAMGPLRMTASEREIQGYLLATARTILADHWRRTLSQPTATLHDDIPAPTLTADVVDGGKPQVRAILARLPERYRQILELRFLCSCSLREVADELGITVNNAKVLQHRALSRAFCLGMQATAAGPVS